jgi:excisionase family DNA binding protein
VKKSLALIPATYSTAHPTFALDPTQILTLEELATRLKVSRRWVYEKSRRRCQNPLPAIRIGRYLRFNWLDVSAWLQRQSTGRAT